MEAFIDFLDQNVKIESQEEVWSEWAYNTNTQQFLYQDGKMYKVTGIEAIRIWIYKALRTERFQYPVYSNEYGTSLEAFIGENWNEAVREMIKFEIEQALSIHPGIFEARVTKIEQDFDKIYIDITVETTEGEVVIQDGI